MSWDMRLDDWKKFCALKNTKNTQKAEPMICDDCFHNTVCRLDGNEMLEWCSARVPSANVVEVKHGHWIEEEYSKEDDWGINNFHYYICSECHKKIPNQYFDKSWVCCPYCRADMRGETE